MTLTKITLAPGSYVWVNPAAVAGITQFVHENQPVPGHSLLMLTGGAPLVLPLSPESLALRLTAADPPPPLTLSGNPK
jgi:hypothetical protein